jgi:curved DNA-binding protein CbpA
METLYDLLGAFPHDDAEALRTAFRRAVKGAHPDLRPGDPDAALKFRQIVRANDILGDAEQRAAYDSLLDLARLEQEQASRRAIAARIYRLASGVMALAGALVVTVGGYLLFMHMSAASVAAANNVDITMHASTGVAAIAPMQAPDTSARRGPAATRESTGSPEEASTPNEAPRGSSSDVDPAGRPDAMLSPAYVDRGMIFYPPQGPGQRSDHGFRFPDMARAKRIERASRPKVASPIAGKQHFSQAAVTPWIAQLFRRRTQVQDPSRPESVYR